MRMRIMAMVFIGAMICSGRVSLLAAQEEDSSGEQAQASFNDLISVMEETTEIATKTKLNADYVPGMVTVFNGKDLEARGVHTVRDALLLAPGVAPAMTIRGDIMVRGVGKWISGKVKLLVNGISVTDIVNGIFGLLFELPVEMVERIELIRGPGSALYGEYAYAGVINVITRNKGGKAFARYGSFDTYTGGVLLSYDNPGEKWSASLNLNGWKSNGDDIRSGPDYLAVQEQESFAPGPTNEKKEQQSAFFTLDYYDFSLRGQYIQRGFDHPFGLVNVLPPPENRLVYVLSQYLLEAKRVFQLFPNFQAVPIVGLCETEADIDKSFLQPFPTAIRPVYGHGIWGSFYEKDRKLYGGAEFTWKGWDSHIFSLNLVYSHTRLVDAWQELNIDLDTSQPLTEMRRYTGEQNFIKEDVSRKVLGAVIQDQFNLSRRLTLTGGLRFDHYDDIGKRLSPRLAIVCRLDDHHILKAQFGLAFRPPTFVEMYSKTSIALGNPDIGAETVRTEEAGYIYRDAETVGRITLFHSKLKDMIELVGNTYQNTEGAELNGVELELERKLTTEFKLDGNISYIRSKDLATGQEIENAASWLGNVGLIFQPLRDYTMALQYHYTGHRHRAPQDMRAKLGSYNTLDITGSVFNVWQNDLTLRAGIRNVFDSAVHEPAPADTYPDDYPRAGREWWIKLAVEF